MPVMAPMQKTATSCEADEEEYVDYEEVEIEEGVEDEDYEEVEKEEGVEDEDYEEVFEDEEECVDYEEVEIEEGVEDEDYEEVEIEEGVEDEDYEEVFEEVEEEEIEQSEEGEEDVKKVVRVLKVQEEEEESVQDSVREEEKSANSKQLSESEGNALPLPVPLPVVFPPFLQSVSDLEKLHCALSKFLYQWNSLNRSVASITAAIDAHAPSQHDTRSTEQEKDERSEQEEENDERSEQEKEKDERSWVDILCEEMEGKALRRYLESNLSDIDRLRHEVPEALRRLPNPEKLVINAIGKFYTQGRRAYNNKIPLVSFRQASILLLEFFVLSGRPTGDSSVKGEAMHGALLWWKRLVNENIESASAVDSLGFILFLACFGIPKDFDSKDLCILLLKSNLNEKIDVFRRSSILIEKIPGVIKDLIREEMHFEAAELSCFFGLTDTFPPLPLLSSFVAKVTQIAKLERQRSQGLPYLVNEANIKELKSLRSVVRCLEDHEFDTQYLASLNIRKMISNLEKSIEKDEMKLKNRILKRKAQHLKTKDPFPSASETSQSAPPQMIQYKSQPPFPDSKGENSALSAAAGGTKEHPYGWERTYCDPSARHLYQPQASVFGNGGGISGRNLHQFTDTVIRHEAQLSKSNRSSNTSPAGAKLGHH